MTRINKGIIEVPKPIEKFGTFHGMTERFFDAVGKIVGAVDCVTKTVSGVVKDGLGSLGFFSGLGIIAAVPSAVSNVSKMIRGSSVVERVKGAFNAAANLGDCWNATNGVLSGLETVGVIAAKSLSWTGVVSAVLFPLQLVEIGNHLHDLKQTREDRKNILSNISVKDLTHSCKYVIANHDSLGKSLCITKHAKIDEMAKTILSKGEAGRKEGEEFVKTIRGRIHTKHNHEVGAIYLKGAAIGSGLGVLATGPNPIALGFAAGTGLAIIGHFGAGKLLLNKNPFQAPKNVWYAKLAEKMRGVFAVATDAMARKVDARFPFKPNLAAVSAAA